MVQVSNASDLCQEIVVVVVSKTSGLLMYSKAVYAARKIANQGAVGGLQPHSGAGARMQL